MSRMVGMLIMMSQSHECASVGLSLGCCVIVCVVGQAQGGGYGGVPGDGDARGCAHHAPPQPCLARRGMTGRDDVGCWPPARNCEDWGWAVLYPKVEAVAN